ncbi:hypothetical protein D1816_15830 [Aquimarina sp. AD10]|uniref:hypothetical protein n=1 Tax=Aquimarina sp. AD10 TaxID=1714849 RepID=UPI000E468CBB|nr:hypothetical protein [Aquimarina sp. AD10]AXT61761.1 hypothetical protein D1816_15830 [Aquimarina sp. AD10]RKN00888.1 hypothetical protein D7033_05935 [Aquimarina sp. AD10]
MNKFFLIGLLCITIACGNDDDATDNPIFCTLDVKSGLVVQVKDGIGGSPLIDGVEVIATENEYKETLLNNGIDIFYGAQERIGTYVITVSKEGYGTMTTEPIVVTKDACHVITQNLEVILEKSN